MSSNSLEAEVAALSRALRAAPDGPTRGPVLDRLAVLAATDSSARQLLLGAIVEHRLAEVSARKVFFSDDLVDDAVQETVLAVANGIGSYRGEAAFLTWLDRVAKNAALQIRRRGQRLSEPVSNEVPDQAAWVRHVSSIVADEVVVAAAFESLAPGHREVIQQREIQGLSYEEMADRLGVPIGTVRSRLNRARAELADRLVAHQMRRR